MIRKVLRIFRKVVILVLTLAVGGTGVLWIDSYGWRKSRIGDERSFFNEEPTLATIGGWKSCTRPQGRPDRGSGLRFGEQDCIVWIRNREGRLSVRFRLASEKPFTGHERHGRLGFSYELNPNEFEFIQRPDGVINFHSRFWRQLRSSVRYTQGSDPVYTYYSIRQIVSPLWAPFILFAAYPSIVFIRGPLRRWRRSRKGFCLKCGYDLRGTPERCPECGKETDATG